MVLIALNIIVFLTGIIGNSLVCVYHPFRPSVPMDRQTDSRIDRHLLTFRSSSWINFDRCT